MPIDSAVLFNYKGKDILIKQTSKGKFVMGVGGRAGIDIWFEKIRYNSLRLARTSGREYARIMIDKMLVSRKEDTNYAKT